MNSAMSTQQRIRVRLRDPNPLFKQWIQCWLIEAQYNNWKSKNVLQQALNSLQKYPLVLKTGQECAILNGFGQTLCSKIDKKLAEYKSKNIHLPASVEQLQDETNQIVKKLNESIREAQHSSQVVSLHSVPVNPKKRTAKTDANKKPRKLKRPGKSCPNINITDPINPVEPVILNSGEFEIVLLVDSCETIGKAKRIFDATLNELNQYRILYEVRRLAVGDFLWICRKRGSTDTNSELVLPYIVERKRMDDLASSIKDGRFHEQKFRLCNSGLTRIMYLVESTGNDESLGMPLTSLLQALINSEVHNEVIIEETKNHTSSMRKIADITKYLIHKFKDNTLISNDGPNVGSSHDNKETFNLMKFNEFDKTSVKLREFKVRGIFVRQLLVLRGLTLEKAIAISDTYATPALLNDAYKNLKGDIRKAQLLLSGIEYGVKNKKIGPTISKHIFNLFSCARYDE